MTTTRIAIQPVIIAETVPDYLPALDAVLRDAALWWASQGGVFLDFAQILRISVPGGLDLAASNPWGAVRQATQHLAEQSLALLEGWPEHLGYGWGTAGLALVGDYAISRLRTLGSPEAIMDDYLVGGLVCHELGHLLGLSHSQSAERKDVMWEWWEYPNVYLDSLPGASIIRRLSDARVRPTPCPTPAQIA